MAQKAISVDSDFDELFDIIPDASKNQITISFRRSRRHTPALTILSISAADRLADLLERAILSVRGSNFEPSEFLDPFDL